MRRIVLIGIGALLVVAAVSWFIGRKSKPQDSIVIPLDIRGQGPSTAATLGMYIIDRPAFLNIIDRTASLSKTDTVASGDLDVYWDHLPYVLVSAAWDDGHTAWGTASDPTHFSVSQGSNTPEAISAAREQVVARMDDLARIRSVPQGSSETQAVLFAKIGDKYKVVVIGLDIAEPSHFRCPRSDDHTHDPAAVEFRKKWAEARAIVTGCTPEKMETETARWVAFARFSN
jgi:hypothetical protein